jgi:hypothetical protein
MQRLAHSEPATAKPDRDRSRIGGADLFETLPQR